MEDVRRKSPFRHPLAIALYVVAGLIVVAGITLTVLFPPSKLKAVMSEAIARSVAREVEFEDVRLSLWPPVRLTVRGLSVGEPGGLAAGRAVSMSSLHLDLSPLPLLARRVVVTRLVLDRPALHLALYADGTTNFDKMMKEKPGEATTGKPSGGGAGAMDLAVQEFRIQDGQVLVDDYKSSKRIGFGLVTRTAFSARQGGKRIDTDGVTTMSNLAFGPLSAARRADLDTSLARLDWRIDHDGAYDAPTARLALEKLALRFGKTEIGVTGVIDRLGARARLDLAAKASRVDLAEILSFVSHADAKALAGISGSGTLDLDLKIQGTPAEAPVGGPPTALLTVVKVLGMVNLSNASFRYASAPAGVEDVNLTASFERDAIRLPKITGRAAGQPLTASFEVERFSDPRARFTVNGNFDLAAVGPLVAPKDVKLGGRAQVALSGSGPVVDPGAMAVQGKVQLQGMTAEAPMLPKKIERVDGAITFSESRATVSNLTARAGTSSFTLDANVARPMAMTAKVGKVPPADVRFTLKSPSLDLDELLPATPGAVETANMRGSGKVEIARYKQKKLEATNVRADLEMEPNVVTVPSFSLNAYGGTATGSARFDTSNPEKPAYGVKARIGSMDAERMLAAFTPVRGLLQGSLSTSLDLSGKGLEPDDIKRTLTAIGLAALAEGQIGPTPALEEIARLVKVPKLAKLEIKDGTMPFRVEQGRVVTQDVLLRGSTGDWRASGAVGFDGGLDYAVSTTLPPEIVSQLGGTAALAAGALADDQGRILVDFRVTGPWKKPRVALDTKAMQARLGGKASQALAEQKEKLGKQLGDILKQASKDSSGVPKISKSTGDSLKKAARDLFKGLFGKAPKDTGAKGPPSAAAPDTGTR